MGKKLDNIKNAEKTNKRHVIISIIKFSLLAIIIVGIPAYIYFFHMDWIRELRDINGIVEFLNQYESESIILYVVFQVIQIVVSVIPGQFFQIAAGYLFGFLWALVYAMAGAIVGTGLAFLIARLLGRDFLHIFFGEEKMAYYIEKLNSPAAYRLVFFLYLIPGIPKDMICYAAGASEMKFKPFLLLASIGRLPGMIGSLIIGTMVEQGNYVGVGIIAGLAVIGFILCIIYRKKIDAFLDKIHSKHEEHKEKRTNV